jgi:formylglycine-generating enzyme required for sulfatase activity
MVNVRVPRDLGRWRIEKTGFATIEGSLTNTVAGEGPERIQVRLDRLEDAPPGMVRVAGGGEARLDLLGHDSLPGRAVPDYWIDRHEVTNRQFKLFMDAGGYQQRELWFGPIVKAGTVLSWQQAAAELRDKTGHLGPSGWAQGEVPAAQADYPVTGVSWYEAAAYCASAGKSLPTVWHWNSAAGIRTSASVVPASNFGGAGPALVGRFGGLGPWGTSDMAGNVKDWCVIPATADRRDVLGGSWGEPGAAFQQADTKDPLTRLATVGFRCVKYMSASEPGTGADSLPIGPVR